jgi:hypothetical protein
MINEVYYHFLADDRRQQMAKMQIDLPSQSAVNFSDRACRTGHVDLT